MNHLVRKARLEDLPLLLEFEQGLIEAFVVELNGEIVASGYAKIIKDRSYLKHDMQGYLGFMYSPKHHRGKGYNKLIMDALIAWCKKRHVFELRLDVYDTNPSAIRAYEKAGFKKHLINMRFNSETD